MRASSEMGRFILAALGGAALAACGMLSGVDSLVVDPDATGPSGDAAADGSDGSKPPDGSSDSNSKTDGRVQPGADATTPCGTQTCVNGQGCCVTFTERSCASTCSDGVLVQCRLPVDCPGALCCVHVTGNGANTHPADVTCSTTCSGGDLVTCNPAAPNCPASTTCQQVSTSLSAVSVCKGG